MRVRENLDIIIDKYLYASRLNSRLLIDADGIDYTKSFETHVKARMSPWQTQSDNFESLRKWIYSLLTTDYDLTGYVTLFNEMWFSRYDKNHYAEDHDHHLMWMSFVYFVKCPRGSSPLIFTTTGKKVKAEEGKVVIFPAWIRHSVPKNRCDDRLVVAGNIMLRPR